MIISLAEKVELIIYVLEQCKAEDRWYQAQQKEAEAEETNLEHEIEGVGVIYRTPPNFKQRGPIATKIQKARLMRRVAKDCIRLNQPLLKFVESEIGSKTLNQLKQTLGELRKVENEMKNRTYTKRGQTPTTKNPQLEKELNKMIKKWKAGNKSKY